MIGGAKGIGLGIDLGLVNQYNRTGSQSYIEPEVLDSLVGVWSAYGMTNDSPNRSTIKNKLSNKGGDFVISNAAFKLNSGFGKYEVDFTVYNNQNVLVSPNKIVSIAGREFISLLPYTELSKTISSYKIKVTGLIGELSYWYRNQDGSESRIIITKDGIYQLSTCYNVENGQGSSVGFNGYSESSCTIEQIPSFQGAFVTDGINDLIKSTKSATEMLDGSNEVTVVSMIHQIKTNSDVIRNNWFFTPVSYLENRVVENKTGKTGIYGYTSTNVTNAQISDITPILGDKNDYTLYSKIEDGDRDYFTVEGFQNQGIWYVSSIAWYWTIIANKVLTTDQINQVIAYFNLDRTLNPDILCNTIKQGITNENHAEFGDKLIDFSGNGRDIQLNNIAWKGDSGIGKYEVDFLDSSIWNSSNSTITSSKIDCKNAISHIMLLYYSVGSKEYPDIPSFKVIKTGADIDYSYIDETGSPKSVKIVDGVNILPASHNTLYSGSGRFCGFGNPGMGNSVTITQIPSHAGALCLDGVNDFGQFVGDLELKDYTFIADRAYSRIAPSQVPFIASTQTNGQAPFLMEYLNEDTYVYPHSFGTTTKTINLNIQRQISYQSTYVYNGNSISKGISVDTGDGLTIGNSGSTGAQYSPLCLWSLMLFPYSMSEFLIERQLKKHKLGTLYPDMVEFRPVIKKDNRIKNVKYYKLNETADYIDLNIGDYIPVGQRIAIVVDLEEPYEITSITSSSLTDVEIRKAGGQNYAYDILGYVTDKSPQKITMDIQVDTNLIQWNPIITSTAELTTAPTFAIRGTSTLLKAGDWIPKNSEIWVIVTMNNLIDELRKFSFNGTFIHIPSSSYNPDTGKYGFPFVIDNESPQNINLTIDEYIRYEDIVQPYPILLGLRDENDNEVSWGDKLRVGSTATFTKDLKDSYLLKGMYNIESIWLNNENVIQVVAGRELGIEKKMEFKSVKEYLLDNNEPKCILSPSRLRMPNSSYKILGYIPDISGHGNHGKINNSAYAKESGVNGYVENFNDWIISKSPVTVEKTDSQAHISHIGTSYKTLPIFEYTNPKVINDYTLTVEITGIPNDCIGKFIHVNTYTQEVTNGINTIKFENNAGWFGFTFYREDGSIIGDCDITIKQIGKYEGAYCLDGVNDHVTIPTLSSGGKQVLMKVNWQSSIAQAMLYDQRGTAFAIWNSDKFNDNEVDTVPAYSARNGGNTYIDGILNKNILASQLRNITHNIVSTNNMVNENSVSPNIGCAFSNSYYSQMSLYDFMLFDNISTDDKIKELNEYVGIEAKVELPPYYWDAYGKTNLDEYKATIQQRGVAEGDYDITNYNHAYDKMSGYGGYNLGRFDKSWASSSSSNTSIKVVQRNPYDITLKKLGGNSDWEFNNTELKVISNPVSVKFKSNKNIRVTCDYHYYPVGGNSEGVPLGITSKDLIANKDAIITISPISQENIDKYNIDVNRGYYLIYFQLSSTLAVNEEVTIEMLPLYPNGLVYDGVTDYSENANIPAFTDFTYILKRQILKGIANSAVMYKGNITVNQGGAFICNYCEPSDTNLFTDFSFGGLLRSNDIDKPIIYGTKTSVNGDSITPGENIDTVGINVGKWVNYLPMVFYKLILYPKTIPLLQINFLKNLMERDEIIDLDNKIFIQE